ncbi:MAG: ParB N-terminal domain-containing protein [Pseudomonadota bacterium]
MSKKRRTFDIDLPDDLPEEVVAPAAEEAATAAPPARRGPMASAISENAEALSARRSAAEAIRQENDDLAHEYVALREAGQVVQQIALDDVSTELLIRDRMPSNHDEELEELVTSIREIGLSNPIRVVARPGQGVELVQGFRRLSAYRRLRAEGGEGWDTIPALIVAGEADIGGLYRRMVDENVVRKDLSFAEMAHIATVYAADPSTEVNDLKGAIGALFQSAPYSKRSYIRSFAYLMERLEKHLMFPTEIPRKLGLTLARRMKDFPEVTMEIIEELRGWENRSIEDELSVLRRHAVTNEEGIAEAAVANSKPARAGGAGSKTKTTFHIKSSAGLVKCTAAEGRLEIKAKRDFSSIERQRLESAIAELIEGLR